MNLKTFLPPKQIILDLAGDSLESILSNLTSPLCEKGVVDDQDLFIADLLRRESEVTTAMENGVAIPHARSNAVLQLGITVGITAGDGILLSAENEEKTRLFFCIAVPSFAPTCHLPLLQKLAKFAREKRRVEKLISCATPAIAARYVGSFKG